MWDLDTLNRMNEQAAIAHQKSVLRAQNESQDEKTNTKTPVYPLAVLARQLISGPPSLGYLVDLFENSEVVAAFMELVSEYLPEHEHEIRVADIDDRIRLFCHYFGQQYFPLHEAYWEEELEQFLYQIPVELMGFSYDDYHEFTDYRTGFTLMLSLVDSPFYSDDDGGRVPIISHVSDTIGRDVASLIPKEGLTPEFLHKRTDGTKFEGVGAFADWVHSQTNCWQLDANYYDYEGEQWSQEVVQALTEQWPRVCEIQDKINRVTEYIEQNPKKRFLQLLELLLDDINTKEVIIPSEQLPLPLF